MIKSILAVIAGVLVIIVVITVVDIVLHAVGVFPPTGQPISDALALLATAYRIVISVGGAWLTARLAPNKPMMHAMILGFVGLVLGLVGVLVTWKLQLGPRWYPILLAVLAIPQCWAGGKLYELQSGRAMILVSALSDMALHKKSKIPPTAVGGSLRSFLLRLGSTDLLIPPTAVGGLFRSTLELQNG